MLTSALSEVRVRVDAGVKREAGEIFRSMGVTTSDVIRMLLERVAADREIPFQFNEPNEVTRAAIAASRSGDVVSFAAVDDLFDDLNAD